MFRKTITGIKTLALAAILAFVFSACEGPQGPAGPAGADGAAGTGFLTEIPSSSGLLGTSWTWNGGSGNHYQTWAFASDGTIYTVTTFEGAEITFIVITYITRNIRDFDTGHIIQYAIPDAPSHSVSHHLFYINGNTLKDSTAMVWLLFYLER